MGSLVRCALVAAGIAVVMAAVAEAQQKPQLVRIRGTITAIEGQNLTVRARDGANVNARLADNARFTAMVQASLADLTPDTYIGVTAMPQADGSQSAIAIHIFQPKQRGTGEGFRPWDLQPGSTMTNATIETSAGVTDGQVVTVRYKQGDKIDTKRVIVLPKTVIVRYTPGDRKDLKVGMAVFLNNAKKSSDGTVEAPTVSYGRDGLVPPM